MGEPEEGGVGCSEAQRESGEVRARLYKPVIKKKNKQNFKKGRKIIKSKVFWILFKRSGKILKYFKWGLTRSEVDCHWV